MNLYNGFYTQIVDVLPPQMISLKEKLKSNYRDGKKWGEVCMDALENIGKQQYLENINLIENYEMIKGRFFYNHYFEQEGYKNMLSQLNEEFEIPYNLRHYDIISPVINTLSGEWQSRPDIFNVKQFGDGATNEYLRTKVKLTKEYLQNKIDAEINRYLVENGIDPVKDDFETPEEAEQYEQQLNQIKTDMTPKEIQRFMDTDFLTQAEIWGQYQKQYDRQFFNLSFKEKIEFEDMCVADRCFRHYYLTPDYYNQETWNPVNTFYMKAPEVFEVENGDYVGRIWNLSLNTLIDRYGHKMSKKHFDMLNNKYKKTKSKWEDSDYDWVYQDYYVPFQHYPTYEVMKNSWNRTKDDIQQLDSSFFENIHSPNYDLHNKGFYYAIEGYWKTQKKLIKITYFDEEINDVLVQIVDENFVIPDYFTLSKNIFDDEHDINTYVETWVTEVWKGIKICTGVDKDLGEDIYLDIGPNDYQFKGDLSIYGAKLPVCGQVFSQRNSRSMSLVDLMKPHQIGFNLMVNQMYQLAEKEIGMFVVMDVNMFPDAKDWGGEDAWSKWMFIAKNMGLLPADTSPENVQSSLAATGGFLPKVIDLNLAAQMVSRQNLAIFFKQMAMEQVGFNDYRLGSFAQSSTAAGVQQGTERSYSQTQSYFTNFSNYIRRCTQMGLDIAQFVQSKKEHIYVNYVKSDLSRAFVKIFGTDISLAQLGIFVDDSQEFLRKLNMLREFGLKNNTAGMSPVDTADIIMMNSPQEIRRQLKKSYDEMLGMQQQQQQQAAQSEQQRLELEAQKIKKEDEQFYAKLENELDKAKIMAGVALATAPLDEESMNMDPNQGFENGIKQDSNSLKREKLDLDRNKTNIENQHKQQELALKRAKIESDERIQAKETETARILKDKEAK